MDPYSIATVTNYEDPSRPGAVIIGGIPISPAAAFSFGSIFKEEYSARLKHPGDKGDLEVKTRIRFARKEQKLKFFDIFGYYYLVPTYVPASVELRADVPSEVYKSVMQNKSAMNQLLETLEDAVKSSLLRCKI